MRATADPRPPSRPAGDQLLLLDERTPAWRLDRQTCEIGRRGVASARAALRRAESAGKADRGQPQAA